MKTLQELSPAIQNKVSELSKSLKVFENNTQGRKSGLPSFAVARIFQKGVHGDYGVLFNACVNGVKSPITTINPE